MGRFRDFIAESAPPHHPDGSMDNYNHATENVPVKWLKKLPGNKFRHSEDHINKMAHDIKTNGIKEPLIINVGKESRTAKLGEGNHRLEAIHRAGFSHAPARVIVGHEYGKEHAHTHNYHNDLVPQKGVYHRADDRPSNVFKSLRGQIKEAYHTLHENVSVVRSEIRVFQKRNHCWPERINQYRGKIKSGEKLAPIHVKKSTDPRYNFDMVDGHHRYYASKDEGKHVLDAKIVK